MWPCMVPAWMCNKMVHVCIGAGELNEDGQRVCPFESDAKGNVQFNAKAKLTADKKIVEISGKVVFPGDLCPEVKAISCGTVEIDGQQYTIYTGRKSYNPDGSVNFTELELI